jgi:hypothetical protein
MVLDFILFLLLEQKKLKYIVIWILIEEVGLELENGIE